MFSKYLPTEKNNYGRKNHKVATSSLFLWCLLVFHSNETIQPFIILIFQRPKVAFHKLLVYILLRSVGNLTIKSNRIKFNCLDYSRLKIPLYIPGSIKTRRIYTQDFVYPARITMKLYDMIQVYSSCSTVIMHMHCIRPVLHMTSCLVAINKNGDMCFDMKNGKKTYIVGKSRWTIVGMCGGGWNL